MPAIGDIWQVTFVNRLGAQNGLVVTHWSVTFTQGTGASAAQIGTKMDTVFAPLFKAAMAIGATYKGVVVQQLTPAKTDRVATVGGAGPGTVVGEPLPPQSAGLLSIRTGYASRSRRGRKYIPFPGEAHCGSIGEALPAYQTLLQAIGTALLTEQDCGQPLDNTKLKFGVYSRKTNAIIDATQALPRAFFATQRRRSHINRGDAVLP